MHQVALYAVLPCSHAFSRLFSSASCVWCSHQLTTTFPFIQPRVVMEPPILLAPVPQEVKHYQV